VAGKRKGIYGGFMRRHFDRFNHTVDSLWLLCGLVALFASLCSENLKAQDVRDEMKPGVRAGAGFLKSSVFIQDERLKQVSHIRAGDLDPAAGNEIGFGTRTGALLVNSEGKVLRFIKLAQGANPLAQFAIVPWPGENHCRFLRVGNITEPALLDDDGNVLWVYKLGFFAGGSLSVAEAADLDGDGLLEIALAVT
jgi:hypothetical protein